MSHADIRAEVQYAHDRLTQYWTPIFAAKGYTYSPPTIILTSDPSLAHNISYIPSTQTINLNSYYFNTKVPTTQYRDAGASYIYQTLAHENGHHIAHLFGFFEPIAYAQAAATPEKSNAINACGEMQADFLAGISLKGANLLYAGEPDYVYYGSASDANDTNRIRAGVPLDPATYTHGTAKQMSASIYEGMQTGDYNRALNMLSGIGASVN